MRILIITERGYVIFHVAPVGAMLRLVTGWKVHPSQMVGYQVKLH